MTTGNRSGDDFKRAMVVTAHPDDAEYGCSATVAKWCRLGWDVIYVLCTDGSKGSEDREISSEELIKLRAEEQREAGKILGLKDVVFLGYPDGYLEPTLEVRKDISREIRRWKPDVLIASNPTRDLSSSEYLGHPDHFAAGEATLSAVFPSARDHLTFPELVNDEGLEPHKVREVWVMSFGLDANFWNPLEEQDVDTSIAALAKHASQVGNPEESAKWMKQRRADLGKRISADYAESFRKFTLG
jgi:LmbE family N-acetylglucosaminyl deacetylase